jgi:superfamily I DNA/RNA helicase
MDETKGLGDESIKVLDVRQENHARNMGNGHRIIYGVPGSGKTVILVARAKLIASANPSKNHLFLCYNVALALHLRHLLKDHGNVVVRHFDRLSWDLGVGRQDREDNDSLGQRLLDTLKARNDQFDKYSSVFIDEAQDFAESWFRCALEVMEDRLDGDLLIVGDGNQGLYRHHDFTWASVGVQAVGRTINTKFDLDRCYRSTKEVMTLAQAFATGGVGRAEEAIASMQVDPESCTRSSGFKPVVMGCKGLEEECHYTAALVNELMAGKWFGRDIPTPLQPSEIGILYREAGDERKQNLLDQLETTIGKAIWVNRDRKARERIIEPGVKIQTIHSSKGLQYKAVIVLWAGQMPSTRPNDDLQTERRLMFVGLTRAEDYLTILHSTSSPFVDELVKAGAGDVVQGYQ